MGARVAHFGVEEPHDHQRLRDDDQRQAGIHEVPISTRHHTHAPNKSGMSQKSGVSRERSSGPNCSILTRVY